MAQSDYNIDATVTPAQLRAELNLILQSVVTNNSGPSEPSPTFPLMLWGDTLSGFLKIRNTGNTGWIVVGRLDSTGLDIHVLRRLFYRLGTTYPGADANTVQPLLGVGAPVEAATTYEFELVARLQKTAGTTSHSFSLGFGGTATVASLAYLVSVENAGVGTVQSASNAWITTNGNSVLITSITTASANFTIRARGTIATTSAGTLVPQYQLSTAPGGAYTVQPGSFMNLLPLGSAAGNLNLGGWT